jgi:hypothetical protein
MPNPLVLEMLENERDTITKAINILKYGSGQKRRGRPPNGVREAQGMLAPNGNGKSKRISSKGEARRLAGLKRYWRNKRKEQIA